MTRLKSQHIHQVVEKHFGGAKVSLLDIGCGAGAIHSFLEKSFERIEGIDPSSSMLSMAEEKNPRCHYRVNTESTLPYSNGSFEVTLSICVLHHILAIDQKKFIEEMVRVTKPGGLVLVLENNPFNPVTRYIFSHNEIDATA